MKKIIIPDNSILGLNYNGAHDSAIALVSSAGEPVFACALERVTREKQDGRPPHELLDGLPWEKISEIAVSTDRETWGPKHPYSRLHPVPLSNPRSNVFGHGPQFLDFVDSLQKPKHFVCHQASHAASAFWPSGFDEALVLTYDGGVQNCPWFGGLYKANRKEGVEALDRFPSTHYAKITTLYSIVTSLSGFTPNKHEGKITGLAAYGKPTERCRDIMANLLTTDDYYLMERAAEWFFMYSGNIPPVLLTDESKRLKLLERFEGVGREEMAATVQAMAEEHVIGILDNAKQLGWNSGSICLAGGLFANVKINQLVKEIGFEKVFVAPPMTDDGTALGAALYVASKKESFDPPKLDHMFLGHAFEERDVVGALENYSVSYKKLDDPAKHIANILAEGKTVGVFQGAMEFGPRALGSRSILCQATDKTVNETLNEKLSRTEFMPFAPIARAEDTRELFLDVEGAEHTAEFMTITFDCTESMKAKCPGVVHIDGTARPQLVHRAKNPLIHDILTSYKEITAAPCLVNTSFNVHEEPIVRTPEDAIKGFLEAGLDCLYLEGGYMASFDENAKAAAWHLARELKKRGDKHQRHAAVREELFSRKDEMQKALEEKEAVIQQQARIIDDLEKSIEHVRHIFHKLKLALVWKTLSHVRASLSTAKWLLSRKIGSFLNSFERLPKNSRTMRNNLSFASGSKSRETLKLSIVTPSYNHGKYIETTIKSVLANNYPNLEYIIMDGGSSDDTGEVAAKYQDRITKYVSEKDNGQADAINKGFRHATGDIYAYMNSDDYYFPEAFGKAVKVFEERPDVDVVYGYCVFVYADGQFMRYFTEVEPFDEYRLRTCTDFIMQPATFFRKEAYEKANGFDASLRYVFDWDFWCRLAREGMKFHLLEEPLAVNRAHPETKTYSGGNERLSEIYKTVMRHKMGLVPHAIFNYTLTELAAMDSKWFLPFARPLGKLACYNQIIYNMKHLAERNYYGLYPGSNFTQKRVVYHLPWYGPPANKITFKLCVPWIRHGKQKANITLNGKPRGSVCYCAEKEVIDVAIDCSDTKTNHYVLELEFSRELKRRYGGVVYDLKIS